MRRASVHAAALRPLGHRGQSTRLTACWLHPKEPPALEQEGPGALSPAPIHAATSSCHSCLSGSFSCRTPSSAAGVLVSNCPQPGGGGEPRAQRRGAGWGACVSGSAQTLQWAPPTAAATWGAELAGVQAGRTQCPGRPEGQGCHPAAWAVCPRGRVTELEAHWPQPPSSFWGVWVPGPREVAYMGVTSLPVLRVLCSPHALPCEHTAPCC